MIIIRIIITLSLFFGIYWFLNRTSKSERRRIKEIKDTNEVVKDDLIKGNKFNIKDYIKLKVTQDDLDRLGNPLKLTPTTYYIIKAALVFLVFISTMVRSHNIIISILVSPLGFFLIDLFYKRSNKNDLDLLRLDIADVYDSLIFSVRSGETLGIALANVYMVATRSKRLRENLLMLSAKINMTANVEDALADFKNKFNFTETNLFVNGLLQALKTGLVENVLDGQAVQVKRKNIDYLKIRNSKITNQVFIIAMMVFVGAIALIFLALGTEVGKGIGQIFSN